MPYDHPGIVHQRNRQIAACIQLPQQRVYGEGLLHIIGRVLDRPRQNLLAGRPFDIKLEVGDVLIADPDSERSALNSATKDDFTLSNTARYCTSERKKCSPLALAVPSMIDRSVASGSGDFGLV